MSIVVKFPGQTETPQLPDIPVAYPDGFPADGWPDLSTLKYHTVFVSTLGGYHLAATEYPLGYISMGDDGDWLVQATSDDFIGISETANCVVLACDDGDTAWVPRAAAGMTHDRPVDYEIINPNANPVLGATMLAWYAFGTTDGYLYLLWSDYDIKKTSDLDADTGAINSWETEPYHKSDVSKPPFILPDGTEIPAFPDGWSDGSPYGALIFWDLRSDYSTQFMCALYASDKPLLSLPVEVSPDPSSESPLLCIQPGFLRGFQYIGPGGEWSEEMAEEITEIAAPMSMPLVVWSNHDILNITSASEDGSSYTIGTEIAYQSNENYRVTGGYMTSIANEARRLGDVTGSMKPDVVESTLRSAGGGGGSDIPSIEGVLF